MKKSNLTQRTFSALIFLVIFSLGIFVHQFFFAILFQTVMVIAIIEFFNFGKVEKFSPHKIYTIIVSVLFFTYIFLFKNNILDIKYLVLSPALFLIPMIFELFKKSENPLINLGYTSLAVIYITLPFSLLNFLVFPKINNNEFSYQLIFGLFWLIWTFDSGAYFAGSAFGKHKLFERISPKKTWEGVIGGFIASFGMSYVMYLVFGTLKIHEWLIVSFIISTTSIFGDLVESMLKRNFNIKDSGKIMPGHGGILDRIDSSLFSIPFVVIYLFLSEII